MGMCSIDPATLSEKLQPTLAHRNLRATTVTVKDGVLFIETDGRTVHWADTCEVLRVELSSVTVDGWMETKALVTSNCPRGGKAYGFGDDPTTAVMDAVAGWYR